MKGDKFQYKCFKCEEEIIVRQTEAGVKPMVFDCLSNRCNSSRSLMRMIGSVNAIGKRPGYELVSQPNHTKLKLQKIEEATDE